MLKLVGVPEGVEGMVRRARYDEVARELYGCLTALLFTDLPPDETRADLACKLLGTTVSEGLYVLDHLRRSLDLPGDICEFGVAQGATSALIANEIRATDKSLWLFDTFAGLPKPTEEDVLIDDIFNLGSMDRYEGRMAHPVVSVRRRLDAIAFPPERVQIVPGMIEDTVKHETLPERVCFAYVDFDFYSGITVALEFLDSRLPAGGHVVVDDYGFFSAGAKQAVDEFVEARADRYELTVPHEFAGHFCMLRRTT
ncbi:MAG: TylF/MycF/NovP-related O-methyltransferase [Planctomycetota bacterium]|jgi:hypothetical protein